jgi:uncharacterized protein with GYD domain
VFAAVAAVPKDVTLFSVTSDALARFVENPEDRRGPVSRLVEAAGGRLESDDWMVGQYDELTIAECPDSAAVAALALSAASSGVFEHFETHELIAADDLVGILQRAQTLRPRYRPPGQAGG